MLGIRSASAGRELRCGEALRGSSTEGTGVANPRSCAGAPEIGGRCVGLLFTFAANLGSGVAGAADRTGDVPLVGKFDGDARASIGVYREGAEAAPAQTAAEPAPAVKR